MGKSWCIQSGHPHSPLVGLKLKCQLAVMRSTLPASIGRDPAEGHALATEEYNSSANNRGAGHLVTERIILVQDQARGGKGAGEGFGSRAFQFFVRNWTRFLLLVTVVVLVILVSAKVCC